MTGDIHTEADGIVDAHDANEFRLLQARAFASPVAADELTKWTGKWHDLLTSDQVQRAEALAAELEEKSKEFGDFMNSLDKTKQ